MIPSPKWPTVKVECHKCHARERASGSDRVTALIVIRLKGWKYINWRGWKCPDCIRKDKA